ncbi:hypothetical protein FPHYL_13362, partial [Fusarium phyllophilum]
MVRPSPESTTPLSGANHGSSTKTLDNIYLDTTRSPLQRGIQQQLYTEISEANHGSLMLFPGIHHTSIRGEPWFVNTISRNPNLVEYTSGNSDTQ